MSGFVRTIFGGTSPSERRAADAQRQQVADNRRVQEIGQAQTLQQQGQQSADLEKQLGSARKAGRGRRQLLADPSGKATVG